MTPPFWGQSGHLRLAGAGVSLVLAYVRRLPSVRTARSHPQLLVGDPLVLLRNRNVEALRDAFEEELGYGRPKLYRQQVRQLIERHHQARRQ